MNLLYGNYNGDYISLTDETEIKGYQLIGEFDSIDEKLGLIAYFETMFLEELYWDCYQIEEEDEDE